MLLNAVATASNRVAGAARRKEKTALLADVLRESLATSAAVRSAERAVPAEPALAAEPAVPSDAELCSAYLSGQVLQEKLGAGYTAVRDLNAIAASKEPSLTLLNVHQTLHRVAQCSGKGSKQARHQLLSGLFRSATGDEQEFLRKLLLGELRQGALEAILLDAVAEVSGVSNASLQRALLVCGSFRDVATQALLHGEAGLAAFRLQLFQPLAPMLAQPAVDMATALKLSPALQAEFKLDGARVQVHKLGDEIRVFSRQLNDVTLAVPELVTLGRGLRAERAILDGEAIALRPDGKPEPFQVTMRRFGRKKNDLQPADEVPLSCFFFDCLHVDGRDVFDAPYRERQGALDALAPSATRIGRAVVRDGADIEAALSQSLTAGHEGLVIKDLNATYEPGRRGSSWLKLKPVHTLDLVVLAAEWGSGRRQGMLSNLHLGARSADGFVMLGKTFKGLTDAMLQFQTQALLQREVRRDAQVVFVRPELVVEIAFDGVQRSARYPGGVALRFARVKQYRADKSADQVDTLAQVQAYLSSPSA